MTVNNPEVEALYKKWKYDFEYWRANPWFDPVKMVEQADTSESYEMDRATIFKNRNGSLDLVYESGCSCYEPSSAEVNLFPNMRTLKLHLKGIAEKDTYSNDARKALLAKLDRKHTLPVEEKKP